MHATSSPVVRGLLVAGLIAATATGLLAADPGTWSVRARATYIDTANKSDAFSALETNFAANAVHVESKTIPEIDIAYWFTKNLAAELVLTIPQEHEVTLDGVGSLGSFKHLPPCLMAQYHFTPDAKFQPYVGLGLNFTLIMDVDLEVANVPLDLESSSLGFVGQIGFDYAVSSQGYINVDLKKVMLESDVLAGGARLTTAELNPWLISVGYGWRF